MKNILLPAIACALLIGCASPIPQTEPTAPVASAPTALTDAEKAKIEETSKTFVANINAGNMEGVSMAYTEDAVLLPPGVAPIKGRAAIEAFFKTFPPIKNMVLNDSDMVASGDYVYTHGRYSMTLVMPDKSEVNATGSYLDVRKRQSDGSWLYVVDTWTEDAPPAERK